MNFLLCRHRFAPWEMVPGVTVVFCDDCGGMLWPPMIWDENVQKSESSTKKL